MYSNIFRRMTVIIKKILGALSLCNFFVLIDTIPLWSYV